MNFRLLITFATVTLFICGSRVSLAGTPPALKKAREIFRETIPQDMLSTWRNNPEKSLLLNRLTEVLGWQFRSRAPFRLPESWRSRIQINQSDTRSISPVEMTADLDQTLLINIQTFLMDPEYSCRRPLPAQLIAKLFDLNLDPVSLCTDVNYRVVLWNDDFANSESSESYRVINLNPKRVYDIEYLLAGPGEAIYQMQGHSMFRIVVCSPERTEVSKACLEDIDYHIVGTFAANPLERVSDLGIGSALDGISSNMRGRLYLSTYPSAVREYSLLEDRPLESVSCQLDETKKVEFLNLIQQWQSELIFGYDLLKDNCATGAYSLGRSVLNDPASSSSPGPFSRAPTLKTPSGVWKAFMKLCQPVEYSNSVKKKPIQESRSQLVRSRLQQLSHFYENIEKALTGSAYSQQLVAKTTRLKGALVSLNEEIEALSQQITQNDLYIKPLLEAVQKQFEIQEEALVQFLNEAESYGITEGGEEGKERFIELAKIRFGINDEFAENFYDLATSFCFFYREQGTCKVFIRNKALELDLKYREKRSLVQNTSKPQFEAALVQFQAETKSLFKKVQKSPEVILKKTDAVKRKQLFRTLYEPLISLQELLTTQEKSEMNTQLEEARRQLIELFDAFEIFTVGESLNARLDLIKDLSTTGSGLKKGEKSKFQETQDLLKEALKKLGRQTLETNRARLEHLLRAHGYYEKAEKQGISFFFDLMVIFYKQAALLPRDYMPSWGKHYGIPTQTEMNELLVELERAPELLTKKEEARKLEAEIKSYLSNPEHVSKKFLKKMEEYEEKSQSAIQNRLFFFSCLIYWGNQCLKFDSLADDHPQKAKINRELMSLWTRPEQLYQGGSGFRRTDLQKEGDFVLFDLYRWNR